MYVCDSSFLAADGSRRESELSLGAKVARLEKRFLLHRL